MNIEMKFEGLDELIKITEKLASQDELEKNNKKILMECGELAYEVVKPLIHRSKDNSKSGPQHKDWGYRQVPPCHAADFVPPPRIKHKNNMVYVVVGWEKSSDSPFFYMKFEEWGTSKRPPHHAFGKVNKILRRRYDNIAIKHYEKLIKELEK